jgi:hypothetical protein
LQVTDQGRARHRQTGDKHSKSAPLSSIDQPIPSEDIKVAQTIQMSRVNLSGTGIEQIVGNEERVPGVDEINRGILSNLKIAIQSKEPLEGTIDNGVMESDRVQAVVAGGPKEKLILA